MTLKMPASYGVGISYRHSDAWNLAMDVYRTEWSKYVLVDERGVENNPVDTRPISEGRLKDTTQVRLGTEYLIIKDNYVIPLRGGLFYDPEPTKKGSDDYYGFSLGTGLSKKKFSVDASYQFRFGRKVSSDLQGVTGANADINQHTIMMSVIYYF
jgi:long-subunit fatty acid transport protein